MALSESGASWADNSYTSFLTAPTGDADIDADLKYIYELDWSQSSVGRIDTWPRELLVLVNLAMLSPQPQLFLLGPDSVILYNTAYGRLLRDHHPNYQGRPIVLNEALIANAINIDRIKQNATSRENLANEDLVPFFFRNNGCLEEVFLSATMVKLPMMLAGYHATTYETTAKAVHLRRKEAYDRIFSKSNSATDVPSLCQHLLHGLGTCEQVVPFALVYSSDQRHASANFRPSHEPRTHTFRLEGTVGDFSKGVPSEISLFTESLNEKWISVLEDAVTSRSARHLDFRNGTMPDIFRQASTNRCYGDVCDLAVVLPSSLQINIDVRSIIILGIAARRPYDETYEQWINTCSTTFATLVTSIVIEEARELVRRDEIATAAKERDVIARELRLKKDEIAAANSKVRLTEARHLKFMETAPMGIMIIDENHKTSFVNKSWLRLTGKSEESVDELDVRSIILPEDISLFDTNLDIVRGTGKVVQFELRLRHVLMASANVEPQHSWVLLTVSSEIVDGKVKQVMVAMTDINNIKFAEAIQRDRLEEAINARKQQEKFFDMTSHEIRNPLGAVLHCTESLYQNLGDVGVILRSIQSSPSQLAIHPADVEKLGVLLDELRDTVDTVQSCSLHQKRITDDILSLSKLDANLVELCESDISIDNLLRQIRSSFAHEASRAGVTLSISKDSSFSEHTDQSFTADSGRIMQILLNLVANAIKFTKDVASERLITICTGVTPTSSIPAFSGLTIVGEGNSEAVVSNGDSLEGSSFLWFSVRDTGCGIDLDSQARIFGRFRQASPKTYNKYGGSGLGLFISRKLVTLLGGKIAFRSQIGQGSSFAFCVRVMRPERSSGYQKPSSDLNSALKSKSLGERGSDVAPISVLLVEDNLINQQLLKKQLERRGFTVSVAKHGLDALNVLGKSSNWLEHIDQSPANAVAIDIVLMDIEMPVMDGIECVKAIRRTQQEGKTKQDIPIIAVTANARQDQRALALGAGMDDVVSKPVSTEHLVAAIRTLLSRQTGGKALSE